MESNIATADTRIALSSCEACVWPRTHVGVSSSHRFRTVFREEPLTQNDASVRLRLPPAGRPSASHWSRNSVYSTSISCDPTNMAIAAATTRMTPSAQIAATNLFPHLTISSSAARRKERQRLTPSPLQRGVSRQLPPPRRAPEKGDDRRFPTPKEAWRCHDRGRPSPNDVTEDHLHDVIAPQHPRHRFDLEIGDFD